MKLDVVKLYADIDAYRKQNHYSKAFICYKTGIGKDKLKYIAKHPETLKVRDYVSICDAMGVQPSYFFTL